MDQIIIKNFRNFKSKQTIPIKTLNLLVGENSTGKSSFLAAMNSVLSFQFGKFYEFNNNPFRLGNYLDIASKYKDGKELRQVRNFSFGFVNDLTGWEKKKGPIGELKKANAFGNGRPRVEFITTYGRKGLNPIVKEFTISFGNFSLQVNLEPSANLKFELKSENKVFITRADFDFEYSREMFTQWFMFLAMMLNEFERSLDKIANKNQIPYWVQQYTSLLNKAFPFLKTENPYAFAPFRSRPRRVYNPVSGLSDPEGSQVPAQLVDLKINQPERYKDIIKILNHFGEQSGLFKRLTIGEFKGKSRVSPFTLNVLIKKINVSLVDVGYGVNQILPLIVEMLLETKKDRFYLLQQPEIHLHPRAQAELGSFFTWVAKASPHRLAIETHSDFIIDRIRTKIREDKENLHKQAQILYFDYKGASPRIYPITFDKKGNLIGAPKTYRDFFKREELRFLGL